MNMRRYDTNEVAPVSNSAARPAALVAAVMVRVRNAQYRRIAELEQMNPGADAVPEVYQRGVPAGQTPGGASGRNRGFGRPSRRDADAPAQDGHGSNSEPPRDTDRRTGRRATPGDNPNGTAQDWQNDWTLFYWGWWISWSPFVGMFLARISYGRTIRAFVGGALFPPVGASFVWLTIFGNSALELLSGDTEHPLAEAEAETSIYVLLRDIPVAGIVTVLASVLAIIVVVLFFATSSDSGSLVVDILTNGGDPHPRWQQRLFWAVLEGVIAAVLLGAGAASGEDALTALQTASIVAGLPFCIVLILMCLGLVRGLASERFVVALPVEPPPAVRMRAAAASERGYSDTGDRVADSPRHSETEVAEAATAVRPDNGESATTSTGSTEPAGSEATTEQS